MSTRKYTEEQEAFLKRFKECSKPDPTRPTLEEWKARAKADPNCIVIGTPEEEHAKRAEELNAMIATTDNPAIKRELRQLIDLDWYQRFDRC